MMRHICTSYMAHFGHCLATTGVRTTLQFFPSPTANHLAWHTMDAISRLHRMKWNGQNSAPISAFNECNGIDFQRTYCCTTVTDAQIKSVKTVTVPSPGFSTDKRGIVIRDWNIHPGSAGKLQCAALLRLFVPVSPSRSVV